MTRSRRLVLGSFALALGFGCSTDPHTVGMVDDGGGAGAGTNDPLTSDGSEGPGSSTSDAGSGEAASDDGSSPSTGSHDVDTTSEPAAECTADEDCVVRNDCCACDAVPIGDEPPDCEQNCLVPSCTGLGLDGVAAACRMGRCEFAPLDCAPDAQVRCAMPPPQCSDGRLARALEGCWGSCIDPWLCTSVPDCSETCPDGWYCLVSQSGATAPHCEPLPLQCEGVVGCDCIAPYFDEVCSSSCAEASATTILCEDGG